MDKNSFLYIHTINIGFCLNAGSATTVDNDDPKERNIFKHLKQWPSVVWFSRLLIVSFCNCAV